MLFDLVLGYGAAPEPAEELLKLLNATNRAASPLLIAHVCGTQSDPQQRSVQIGAFETLWRSGC